MARSRGGCVCRGVGLISSARSTLANTGPCTKRNARRPVVWSSSSTSVPVMSEGIRSGVNWMRLKLRESASASVEMSSVLARPGTPTNRQCPRAKSATRSCSITPSWPTTRLAISASMRFFERPSSSISSASEARWPWPTSPFMSASPGAPGKAAGTCSLMENLLSSIARRRKRLVWAGIGRGLALGRLFAQGEEQRALLARCELVVLEVLREPDPGVVELGIEGVQRDRGLQRRLRRLVRLPRDEHARQQHLPRLVLRILARRRLQRLLGLLQVAELELGKGVAPRDHWHLRGAHQLSCAPVLVRRRAEAPAREHHLAQAHRPLRLRVERLSRDVGRAAARR